RRRRVVDGDDGAGDVIAAIGRGPASEGRFVDRVGGAALLVVVVGQEAVPLGDGLAKHDGVGRPVGHRGDVNLAAEAVEHAAQMVGIVGVAIDGAPGVSPVPQAVIDGVAVDVERGVPAPRGQALGTGVAHVVADPGVGRVVIV